MKNTEFLRVVPGLKVLDWLFSQAKFEKWVTVPRAVRKARDMLVACNGRIATELGAPIEGGECVTAQQRVNRHH